MRRLLSLDLLDGPPPALPAVVDRLSERWWVLPPRWRFAVVGILLAVALGTGSARMSGSPYGPPSTVVVATRDLGIGEELGPGDLRAVDWPRSLIPDAATGKRTGRLAAPLPRGSVLTSHHLATGGIAALLPTGAVAVPLPVDEVPVLEPGFRVDLIGRDLHGAGTVLASDADVLTVDAATAWLAVPRADAPDVAAASGAGQLTVAVLEQ